MIKPFQFFAEEDSTEYINLNEVQSETHQISNFEANNFFLEAKFMRSEDLKIEKRRVVGILELLGNVGGIQQSVFIVGAVLNFLVSGKDQALSLMEHHFYTNDQEYERIRPKSWLEMFQDRKRAGVVDRVIFGSILSWLPACVTTSCRKNRRRDKFLRLLDQADKQVERSLDIRTMLQMQSMMLAIIRVLFSGEEGKADKIPFALLRLQRGSKLLDLRETRDEVESLLYGSDEQEEVYKSTTVSSGQDSNTI